MATHSKAQKAALLRVQAIRKRLREELSGRNFGPHSQPLSLDYIQKDFTQFQTEIAALLKEHNLDESVLAEFTRDMTDEIYTEAGKRGEHAWQAHFAKKYGM